MRSAGIPRAMHLRLPSRDGKREPNELSSLLRVSCQLFGGEVKRSLCTCAWL